MPSKYPDKCVHTKVISHRADQPINSASLSAGKSWPGLTLPPLSKFPCLPIGVILFHEQFFMSQEEACKKDYLSDKCNIFISTNFIVGTAGLIIVIM